MANNNNGPILDAQAFADAHLAREEQKALGTFPIFTFNLYSTFFWSYKW